MKRICLGKIAAAHGVKGLVKIFPFCEDVSLISRVFTSETGEGTLDITLKNPLGKYILAEIKGVHDRNAAEALTGCSLYVSRETLPEIEDEESFYFDDLVGLTVLSESGEHLGHVLAATNFGASDLLEIQPPDGESYYLPFTDDYVPHVDIEGQTITIRPIEMV